MHVMVLPLIKECAMYLEMVFLHMQFFEACLNYCHNHVTRYLMKGCPLDHRKYIDEAAVLSGRRRALHEVMEVPDPITPPKRLTYFT